MIEGFTTLLGMANYMNAKGVKTARIGKFATMTVERIVDRLGLAFL
jgi:hypothetical protein